MACLPSTPTAILTTSEEFVTAAWKAHNGNDFDQAIKLAQECVNKWEAEAITQQNALSGEPPNGIVTEEEKKEIFAHWALNDVGTAYFIIAEASLKNGKTNEAKLAYEKVKKFPFARTWDPKGWFWSPAKEASKRLTSIP